MACEKYKLDYHESPRVYNVAFQWDIKYEDAAELIQFVDLAQI